MKFHFDRPLAEKMYPRLAGREIDCLANGLAMGWGLTAIAARLGVSPKTIRTYRARILAKLCLSNEIELALELSHTGVLVVTEFR